MTTQPQRSTTAEKQSSPVFASNVFRENFVAKAKDYVQANGGRWHVINPVDHPQQWGAWWSYRRSKKMEMSFLKYRGRELLEMRNPEQRKKSGYTVPSLLPSDFDEERDYLDDKIAGDWFMEKMADRKKQEAAFASKTPEEKKAIVDRVLKGVIKNV